MGKTSSRRTFLKAQAAYLSTLALSSCAIRGVAYPPGVSGEGQKYSYNPDMMAIGDSLFQGVRSLSIAPNMVQLSPPTLISKAVGISSFISPDYPLPIGWNVEDIFKNKYPLFVEIPAFGRNLLTNLKSWDYLGFWNRRRPWSKHEAFDNISVGGATISDLWQQTAGAADDSLRKKLVNPRIEEYFSIPLNDWSNVWSDMNTSLTLNPSGRNEQHDKSQLQQVIDRRPKYLYVNIGSNDGLFQSCFLGRIGQSNFDVGRYEAQMEELFRRLGQLPMRTEKIVFNSLVRPRTVPNLMPASNQLGKKPGDMYFDGYNANLFSERISVTKENLQDFDRVIQHVNESAQIAMQKHLKGRGVFVDFFQASSGFDSKHYADREIPVRGRLLTNTPIEFHRDGTVSGGGLTGLDNMHPTGPGYAIYANTILQAVNSNQKVSLDSCYDDDRLLTVRARRTYRRAKEVRQLVNLLATLSKVF